MEKLPSPKLQLNANGDTPPERLAVNVTGNEVSGETGSYVKLTVGAVATVTVWLELATPPLASRTVRMTMYEPDDV